MPLVKIHLHGCRQTAHMRIAAALLESYERQVQSVEGALKVSHEPILTQLISHEPIHIQLTAVYLASLVSLSRQTAELH